MLNPSVNSQTYSSTYSEGVKLLIHQRDMFPSDLSVEKMISHRSENILRISTTLTMCSKAVRDLAMEDRECLFMTERKLRLVLNVTLTLSHWNYIVLKFTDFSPVTWRTIVTLCVAWTK